jgi:hypothetical protein
LFGPGGMMPAMTSAVRAAEKIKVFCFFSSEKKDFLKP